MMDTTESKTLEQRGFVATAEDIERLAHQVIDSKNMAVDARSTYLRALIASTQEKLGLHGKKVKPQALTPQEVTQQLEALDAIHEIFYKAVTKAILLAPPQEDEKALSKAGLVKLRGVFARTAKTEVKGWIAAGISVARINPARVTKNELREGARQVTRVQMRAMSQKMLGKKVHRLAELIRARSRSPQEAGKLLRAAITQLREELSEIRGAVPLSAPPAQQPERQEAIAA